jgi:hypothetical protein
MTSIAALPPLDSAARIARAQQQSAGAGGSIPPLS